MVDFKWFVWKYSWIFLVNMLFIFLNVKVKGYLKIICGMDKKFFMVVLRIIFNMF